MFDWLFNGPLSRLGGDSQSDAARYAKIGGAAGGGVGAGIGYLAGKVSDMRALARMNRTVTRNNQNFPARQGARTDWSLGDSPLAQFDNFGHGEPTQDESNIGSELGITDWGDEGPTVDGDSAGGAVKARSDEPTGPKGWAPGKGFMGDAWTGMSGGGDVHGMVIRGVQPGLGSGQKWFHGRSPGK